MGINSFNTGFNPSAPLVAAGGAAPAQGISHAQQAHHHHLHRDGVTLNGGNRQLAAGVQSLRTPSASWTSRWPPWPRKPRPPPASCA